MWKGSEKRVCGSNIITGSIASSTHYWFFKWINDIEYEANGFEWLHLIILCKFGSEHRKMGTFFFFYFLGFEPNEGANCAL